MKMRDITKLAAVSLIALGTAFYGVGSANAAAVLSGVATTVPVTANVVNSFTVITTPLNFGKIGAISKITKTATGTVGPGLVVLVAANSGATSGDARIIPDTTTPPATASVTITGALDSTIMYVDYGTIVDMTDGVKKFWLVNLDDNLDNPDVKSAGGTAGHYSSGAHGAIGGATSQGHATTTAGGALTFHIGGKFSTDSVPASFVYPNNTYNGSFDVTISY